MGGDGKLVAGRSLENGFVTGDDAAGSGGGVRGGEADEFDKGLEGPASTGGAIGDVARPASVRFASSIAVANPGTVMSAWHLGQRALLPAADSGTRKSWPHWLQRNSMGIVHAPEPREAKAASGRQAL